MQETYNRHRARIKEKLREYEPKKDSNEPNMSQKILDLCLLQWLTKNSKYNQEMKKYAPTK